MLAWQIQSQKAPMNDRRWQLPRKNIPDGLGQVSSFLVCGGSSPNVLHCLCTNALRRVWKSESPSGSLNEDDYSLNLQWDATVMSATYGLNLSIELPRTPCVAVLLAGPARGPHPFFISGAVPTTPKNVS